MNVEASTIARRLCLDSQRDAAMSELVSLYGDKLYRRIAQLVGSGSDADDVFQDALLKILRNAHQFDGRSQFFSWLYRIVTNQSLDHLRAKKRRTNRVVMEMHTDYNELKISDSIPNSQGVDAEQAEDLLLQALSELPEQQRIIFEERYYHETPYGELAVRYGKSEGGLKANYHHAVQKVTNFIKQHAQILNP